MKQITLFFLILIATAIIYAKNDSKIDYRKDLYNTTGGTYVPPQARPKAIIKENTPKTQVTIKKDPYTTAQGTYVPPQARPENQFKASSMTQKTPSGTISAYTQPSCNSKCDSQYQSCMDKTAKSHNPGKLSGLITSTSIASCNVGKNTCLKSCN